jgi:hypothetical protein
VIHERRELWWNDIAAEKLLFRPPELSGNPTSSHLVAKQEDLGEENDEFGLMEYLCAYFEGIFNMQKNLPSSGRRLYFPDEEGVLQIFIVLKNPLPEPGLNSRTLDPVASTITITPPRRQFTHNCHLSPHFPKCLIIRTRLLYCQRILKIPESIIALYRKNVFFFTGFVDHTNTTKLKHGPIPSFRV